MAVFDDGQKTLTKSILMDVSDVVFELKCFCLTPVYTSHFHLNHRQRYLTKQHTYQSLETDSRSSVLVHQSLAFLWKHVSKY